MRTRWYRGPRALWPSGSPPNSSPKRATIDARLYSRATEHHLRLLAGAWMMAREGSVPAETAEVFEEAVAWRFGPLTKHGARLPHRTSELARGLAPRDLNQPAE